MDVDEQRPTPAITVGQDIAGRLLARIIPIDRSAAQWPTEPGPAVDAIRPLATQIWRLLQDGPGWTMVDTGLADRTDDEVASAAWNLFTAICEPVPQYRTGELVHLVEVSRAPAQAASTYSQSNQSGSFHTDGTLLDTTPEVAMLAGVRAADDGGETVVIDGDAIVARLLEASPEHVAVLAQPQPFHSGDDRDPVVTHRIIDRTAGRTTFRFVPLYVGHGYARQGRPVPATVERAMEALNLLVEDPSHQSPTLITRGQVLLWNNLRCLHGRRAFTEHRHHRRLLRAYGRRVPSIPRSSGTG